MFTGAINMLARKFLGNVAQVFDGATVVVGCSGNFTFESVLSQTAHPAAIHANDISLYSVMLGRWLVGEAVDYTLADPAYAWLEPYLDTPAARVAALMVILDMLPYEKQDNPHKTRMWGLYQQQFPELVAQTVARLENLDMGVTSFFAGDVVEHFTRFADADAIFCAFAPTYAGGYERLYKRLHQIVQWDEPAYQLLDDDRRDELLTWMQARRYLWYDDRRLPGLEPEVIQESGKYRTVYLYSNLIPRSGYLSAARWPELPPWPLAGADLEIHPASRVHLQPMKPNVLTGYKDAYLSRRVDYGIGSWAYAVYVDGVIVGFLEFTPAQRMSGVRNGRIFLFSDFCVPNTRYRRLSKLIIMLAKDEKTRRTLERQCVARLREMTTMVFTDRPVSMKYRGVFDLEARCETKTGEPYLLYHADFTPESHQDVIQTWLRKHGRYTRDG